MSVRFPRFTDATRELHGRKLELLDAFGFGRVDPFGMPVTFRVERHTIVWGESLFLGQNGVGWSQSSIDVGEPDERVVR